MEIKFFRHPTIIPDTYVNEDGDRIEIMPFFLYEISVDRYIVEGKFTRVENHGSKFIKSTKPIHSKIVTEYYPNKKKVKYCIIKSLVMLGALKEYINSNNFPLWELKKRKNEKRKSSLSKRRVRKF